MNYQYINLTFCKKLLMTISKEHNDVIFYSEILLIWIIYHVLYILLQVK